MGIIEIDFKWLNDEITNSTPSSPFSQNRKRERLILGDAVGWF